MQSSATGRAVEVNTQCTVLGLCRVSFILKIGLRFSQEMTADGRVVKNLQLLSGFNDSYREINLTFCQDRT